MMLRRRPPQTTQAQPPNAPPSTAARLSRLETLIIGVLLFNAVLLMLTLAADGMLTYALSLLR